MKARVKATGHIVDVELSHYVGDVAWYLTKCHASYSVDELEFIDTPEDYWIRLKHIYAGMAIQSLIMTSTSNFGTSEQIAMWANEYATALVKELKEEK